MSTRVCVRMNWCLLECLLEYICKDELVSTRVRLAAAGLLMIELYLLLEYFLLLGQVFACYLLLG